MNRFKKITAIFFTLTTLGTARAQENSLFGYPHLLPSPYTLPAGRLVFGTSFAYGITDFFQVGTNVVSDLYKVYNAQGKLSLVDTENFALGLTLGFEHFNYRDIDSKNPDLSVTSWMPGGVVAFGILEELALFTGGNLNITDTKLKTSGVEKSGLVQGAQVESDLSWAYAIPKKKKGMGNVLSTGVSYDLSYKLFGVGLSHHWPGFQLGFHYYPSAQKHAVLPIIVGGGSVDL